MSLISLYQMGILRHLPHPKAKRLNSDKVDASAEAYKHLSAPDGTLGVASYAVTFAINAAGGKDRFQRHPFLPIVAATKAGLDVAQSVRMLAVQWRKFRSFCFWGLLSSAASFATAALVAQEASAAVKTLRGKKSHKV
jgi:hypothetical protein